MRAISSFDLDIKGEKQDEKNEFEVFSSMPTLKKSESLLRSSLLHSFALCSFALCSIALCSFALCSFVLYSFALCSFTLLSFALYSFALRSFALQKRATRVIAPIDLFRRATRVNSKKVNSQPCQSYLLYIISIIANNIIGIFSLKL